MPNPSLALVCLGALGFCSAKRFRLPVHCDKSTAQRHPICTYECPMQAEEQLLNVEPSQSIRLIVVDSIAHLFRTATDAPGARHYGVRSEMFQKVPISCMQSHRPLSSSCHPTCDCAAQTVPTGVNAQARASSSSIAYFIGCSIIARA